VARADALCVEEGVQFTPVRKRVLELLLQAHRAMGAYQILDQLREDGFKYQPPVAYRALDFLVARGFAHKIEKLNAFIACAHLGLHHSPAFLICRRCASVAETRVDETSGPLNDVANSAGFVIEKAVIEAEGICPNCLTDQPE
jgi:Fur family zinc uptake transcriptional regulator